MQPPGGQNNYLIARDAALAKLKADLDRERLGRLGASPSEDGRAITVPSLCWEFEVRPDPFAMRLMPEDEEVAVVWQILVLNYLSAPEPEQRAGFRSFADFAEGRSYQTAFEGRVNQRLCRSVGAERESFVEAAERLGSAAAGHDPVQCIFRFFPLFELQVVRYEGDEDFPLFCNVLLPDNALSVFSMEDAIVAAERLVSALEGKGPAARTGK